MVSARRVQSIAYWITPSLLTLLIYWQGLTCWFQKDDFAWLGLRYLVHGWRDLLWALFAPMAQGTVRPLSERLFFMSFSAVFGMNPLPFRCFVFLTQAANLMLLSSVTSKLTGSRAAGFWAAVLWTVNAALALVLSWTSASNELLWCFFLLLSFWLLIRYVETADRRYYIAQCITFVLGFGVIELNVIYPALAAVYAFCCARHIIRKIIPLFVISALYSALHFAIVPTPVSGPYKLHWDSSMISTLFAYWKLALGPSRLILFHIPPSFFRSALTVSLSIGLAGFLWWKLRRRQWAIAMFPAWFVISLLPVLPLRDHISDQYLTAPIIGLAMWGGWALVESWRSNWPGRLASLLLLSIYLGVSLPAGRVVTQSFYDRSREIEKLVLGVARRSQSISGKQILLKGIDTEMFWSAIYHRPFRLFGMNEVYLVPDDEKAIAPDSRLGKDRTFFIDPVLARKLLDQHRAVVYDVGGGRIRDITAEYSAWAQFRWNHGTSKKVDVGDDLVADQLGSTWYPKENDFRWMPKSATVKLRGPSSPEEKLHLNGLGPAEALKSGPLTMLLRVDENKLAAVRLEKPSPFSYVFDLPAEVLGRPTVEIVVELDRTFVVPGDPRQLGLAFGSFEIR